MIMTRKLNVALALAMLLPFTAPPAAAQQPADGPASPARPAAAPTTAAPEVPPSKEDAAAAAAEASWTKGRPIAMQYFRPMDKRGRNVFETTKVPGAQLTGFKLDFNGQFTSQVQNLTHVNTATAYLVNGVDANRLAG